MADLPDRTDKGGCFWLKKAVNTFWEGNKIQRFLVHILHREPDNNSGENGLPAWYLVVEFTFVNFGVGVEGEDILFVAEFIFDFEGIVEDYNGEC